MVASPLPTVESDSFHSLTSKRDGINETSGSHSFVNGFANVNFGSALERVVINVGDVEWQGRTFDAGEKGLFLAGGCWGDVDFRKGLVAILELAECLGCSHLIIGFENTLAETCDP
jgi:hypothetical protein